MAKAADGIHKIIRRRYRTILDVWCGDPNSIALLGGFVGPFWMGPTEDLDGSYRIRLEHLRSRFSVGAGMTDSFGLASWKAAKALAYSAKMNKP